jgi:hypothetical protein
MITKAEWMKIPLEARLVEHANHTDDDLLRHDLIAAIAKLDLQLERIRESELEVARLERLAHVVSPY